MRHDAGFRLCAIDPIGCDRSYLDDTATAKSKVFTLASFDKRIREKTRRRPNPNPDLDYTVIEKVEFPTDFDHAEITVCYVDGASKIYIGDGPADVGVLNDDIGGSRGTVSLILADDGKWKLDDYREIEEFAIGKPKCPPRSA